MRVILPYAANRLESLILFSTYNAQAPYLLRAVTPDGTLPTLRSLSIHLLTYPQSVSINILTAKHLWDTVLEGNRWREDERGNVTSANINKAQRWFDGNYIMSISKAAPNLEELELSGTSRDTLVRQLQSFKICWSDISRRSRWQTPSHDLSSCILSSCLGHCIRITAHFSNHQVPGLNT